MSSVILEQALSLSFIGRLWISYLVTEKSNLFAASWLEPFGA